jgi:methyl-accepting chemotaxis protein
MNGLINKIKESIQAKLQLFILSSATIVFLATILYVTVKNRQMELEESIRLTKEVAQKRASNIQSELNKDFALTHTMAAAMQDFVLQSDSVRNNLVPTMLKRVFERNNHLQSLWIHWELSAVVPNYPFTYGRVRKTYFRKGNTIHFKIDTVDTDGDKENGLYYTIKTQKKNVITEPYHSIKHWRQPYY